MKIKCVTAISLVLMLFSRPGTAQSIDSARTQPEVFMYVESMPEFPGGSAAMQQFLISNIFYPDSARIKNIQGKVFVRFVVDANGLVRDAQIVRGVSPELDEEALRVVRAMPTWKPGKQNGKNVSVYFTLPINFVLD